MTLFRITLRGPGLPTEISEHEGSIESAIQITGKHAAEVCRSRLDVCPLWVREDDGRVRVWMEEAKPGGARLHVLGIIEACGT